MTHTYLALGDSYTIGEAVEQVKTFPFLIADFLIKQDFEIATPFVIAKTGWTTDELNEAILEADVKSPYSFVTLLIGVNNQYRGRDTNNFKEEFNGLLSQAIEFAGEDTSRVFVLSIPDWGVTPFGKNSERDVTQIALEIDVFNKVVEDTCMINKVSYTDITPLTREALNRPEFTAEDGLHPSGDLYAEWAKLVAPKILAKIKAA